MNIWGWLIVAIPLAFILYLAINARRYIRGAADFLAAGRVAGRYVIAVGDMESALGVITLVMMIERQYQCGGAIGFWGNIGVPLSLLISLTGYCVYRFRETKALSMGQFLEMRYSRGLRILAAEGGLHGELVRPVAVQKLVHLLPKHAELAEVVLLLPHVQSAECQQFRTALVNSNDPVTENIGSGVNTHDYFL